ncbi:hypothetical protein BIY22_13085 [Vibrio panuliri]|uniref:DUF3135 domain-containing protein n=1 Tax=Vibrio panuliri TaxID=1381081 RepID=A0A1Q9HAP3_9VIBR|nr:DUF3135 domain-containing protein [Vibrio panuliri]OLQ86176.1 hypothetical protein BIY22_13085 [Vibrio panuliri]
MPQTAQQLPPFDELVKLAQEDEAAFEQLKRDKCQEMIQGASDEMQPRLWAQQSHIDRLVGHCKNPHHVNVMLSRELRKQVVKFQHSLQGRHSEATDEKQDNSTVVPFDNRFSDWR